MKTVSLEKWKSDMAEPFDFIGVACPFRRVRYPLDEISKTVVGENAIDISKLDFPENVTEVYYSWEGTKDEENWASVGKLVIDGRDHYFFFDAYCDYTGFDCRGGMTLYLSRSLDNLIERGLDDVVRNNFTNFQK
jgi:hypothetical protein